MGKTQSKIDKATANVINEIEMTTQNSSSDTYLIIIIVILSAQLATTLYQLHKKSIRKNYALAASVANQLDKI